MLRGRRASVIGGCLFDMVDDKNLHGVFLCFELEPQLLFERLIKRDCAVRIA